MAVKIQEERFSDVIEEAQPLLVRHWEEIALNKDIIPLSPNYGRYAAMEAANKLCVVTARNDGNLIGYLCFIIDFSLHYSTVSWAISDVVWVAPEHRTLGVGNGLFDLAEQMLLARGVVMASAITKTVHPALAALLAMRGYAPSETIFQKVLQRPD